MDTISDIRHIFNRNLPILVGICLCLYFSYHTVSGHRSYSRLSQLSTMSQQKSVTLVELNMEKGAIEEKVRMMRPETMSADMLDERVRFVLGYKHADELVVFAD